MQKIIFDDEITIWWQEKGNDTATRLTKLYLDGEYHGETKKTHYTFSGLSPQRTYQVCIEKYDGEKLKTKQSYIFRTAKAKNRLDITQAPYFAIGDGKTDNTNAIQRALDDCTKKDCVYVPSGKFLSGALNIGSNTELYLADGAMLKGVETFEGYLPKIKDRFEGITLQCYRSLINVGEMDEEKDCVFENVVIRGKGTIFGGGLPLSNSILQTERVLLKEYMENNVAHVQACESKDTLPGRARGRLIRVCNTKNVIISGLTLGYGASWNLHFIYSKDVTTYNCKILSDTLYNADGTVEMEHVWNGDGLDPDSSENCVVFNTFFSTFDNAIAIKSGKNPEGNKINRPTKNVYIFDCGGGKDLAIGSEISGGVEGVYVWDCTFNESWGINLKTTPDRGGYIKNVNVKDCNVASITVRTHLCFNNDGETAGTLTKIADLHFENLYVNGVFQVKDAPPKEIPPVFIHGFDENVIQNVLLRNIHIADREGDVKPNIVAKNVKNLSLENIFV